MTTKQTILGPFARIEGDLEIRLEGAADRVHAAYVTAPMFRGFEQMLVGRDPMDALAIAPRVCGICSVSQSMAARNALAQLGQVEAPKNAELVYNLMQGAENLSDLFAHFYLYLMPELVGTAYENRDWWAEAKKRFAPRSGSSWSEALEIRALILGMLSSLAGKWPHSLALLPGGTSKTISSSERAELLDRLGRVTRFLQKQTYGGPLEEFLGLQNTTDLEAWAQAHPDSDLGFMILVGLKEGWQNLGRIETHMLSYGAYPQGQTPAYQAGIYDGSASSLDLDQITEDLASSWLDGPKQPLHPAQGVTQLGGERTGKYSYNKAPRYQNQPVSVGPLSRQVIDGQPLAVATHQAWGQSVFSRVLARWVEVARLVQMMESWLFDLDPDLPFYNPAQLDLENAQAYGLVEAARGSLGHFIEVTDRKISRYQIVAPTSWNFSPRDQTGQPGPCEMALEGLPMDRLAPDLWLVVRSFDPCMQCTVH